MKTILATLTIVMGLLAVAPAMAGPTIDTSNEGQRKSVFDRLVNGSGG